MLGGVRPASSRQRRLWRPWGGLQPALSSLAQLHAQQGQDVHRRTRKASLRSGESLRMRLPCEPSLPLDGIGLFGLLAAPVL